MEGEAQCRRQKIRSTGTTPPRRRGQSTGTTPPRRRGQSTETIPPWRRRRKNQDRTTVAEKAEYTDEKTEHKTQYPAENRDNSYLAANQHMVKFADELRGINEQAALSFDRRKNPAEYDLKEKQEMLEAVTEAFNAANWNSANERRLAADDIAQNLYHPMYPRVEIAEAAVQHKLPGEFIQELKQEKIEYFETKHDEAGVEALNFTVKDMETAERMVEQSGGMFHVVSTRNLDHYRDQFADALYSSDRHEGAAGLMESSLDDAIRLYNGDVSHVRRCPPAGEIRWSAPTGRCPRCSRREEKGDDPRLCANCGAERRVTEDRTNVEKRPCGGCHGAAGARRKRRRRSLTLQQANQPPAGESHDKHPKTRRGPQARPPRNTGRRR